MTQKTYSLHELFSRDEDERLAKARAEMAAEKEAWDELPQSEKDRITAERDAKWAALEDAAETSGEDDDGEDDADDDGDSEESEE